VAHKALPPARGWQSALPTGAIVIMQGTTRAHVRRVFELHAAGKTKVIYERRQLEDVNTAIQEVETGQVRARLVFDLQ
jgi:D-arabinose 1-dehydrogenase-like Zn-dependent alcohol dehydrogenase